MVSKDREYALSIQKGCHIRFVLCDLRVIVDGEVTAAGNSTVSISTDVCGGIWIAFGGRDKGTSGWIGWPVF